MHVYVHGYGYMCEYAWRMHAGKKEKERKTEIWLCFTKTEKLKSKFSNDYSSFHVLE